MCVHLMLMGTLHLRSPRSSMISWTYLNSSNHQMKASVNGQLPLSGVLGQSSALAAALGLSSSSASMDVSLSVGGMVI